MTLSCSHRELAVPALYCLLMSPQAPAGAVVQPFLICLTSKVEETSTRTKKWLVCRLQPEATRVHAANTLEKNADNMVMCPGSGQRIPGFNRGNCNQPK